MKSGGPWQVRGVRPDARETAYEAARRAGQSVGQWLNAAIIDSAADEGVRPPPYGDPQRPRAEDIGGARVERPAADVEHFARGEEPDRPRPTEGTQRIADAIAALERRLNDVLDEGRAAARAIEDKVTSVDRALAELGRDRARAAAAGAYASLDQAVADIALRQRELDEEASPPPPSPRREDLSGLEMELRLLTQRIEALHGPGRMDEAIAALRQDLADISRTLGEASPRGAIQALENEVRALAARLDAGRKSNGDMSALSGLERAIGEVREALRTLTPAENLAGLHEAVSALAHKIDLLAIAGQNPTALDQLESAISILRGLVANVATNDALASLTSEVRALSDRLGKSLPAAEASADILLTLEQRIATIADALAMARAQGFQSGPDLDSIVERLADKIARLHAAREDTVFGQVEERMVGLLDKLDASEARLGHLDAIERGINELLGSVEDLRSRDARAEPTLSPLVENLERDLAELRQSQAAAQQRAQDSLEAVQGTVGDVVDRLAKIETDLRGTRAPLPHPPTTAPVGAAQGSASAARPPAPAARAAERAPIDAGLAPDHPLEPGSGPPGVAQAKAQPAPSTLAARAALVASAAAAAGASPASAAERIAASQAAIEEIAPPPAEPASKPNFILAARRAAKAAAEGHDAETEAGSGAETPSLATRLGKHIKPVLLGVGVLVILAGVLQLAMTYFESREHAVETPPASNAPVDGRFAPPGPVDGRIISPPDEAPARKPADANRSSGLLPAPDGLLAQMPSSGALAPAILAPAPERPTPPPLPAASAPADTTAALAQRPPVAPPIALAPPAASPPADMGPPETAAPPDSLPPAIGSRQLIAAARAGDPAAAYEVGMRWAEGRGVPANPAAAAAWLERAAAAGLAPAQFRLGGMYEKGLGVKRDAGKARALYLAAAEKGNAKAMHNLAVLHAEGAMGKPDYAQAAHWFRKGATHGVADSQFNLGVLFARGIGVEQNFAESYKWFALAALQGDQDAAKKRDEVARRLDAPTLNAARAAVQQWVYEPQPEEATAVKAPAGGWNRAGAPAGEIKPKPRAGKAGTATL